MVVPLFLVAAFVDKSRVIKRFESFKRRVSYSLLGRRVTLSLSHLISGIIFTLFGGFILIYERANPDVFTSNYSVEINLLAARVTRFIESATSAVPDVIWALVFVLLFSAIGWVAYRQAKNEINIKEE